MILCIYRYVPVVSLYIVFKQTTSAVFILEGLVVVAGKRHLWPSIPPAGTPGPRLGHIRPKACFPGGFPSVTAVKNPPACQCKGCGFDPWVRKMLPWSRKWQPASVLPGEPHGQRSLAQSMGSQEIQTLFHDFLLSLEELLLLWFQVWQRDFCTMHEVAS